MVEVREAMNLIKEVVSPEAHVFYGQVIDPDLDDRIKVTVIATGLPVQRPGTAAAKHKKLTGDKGTDDNKTIDFNRPAYTYWRTQKLK
jgi:cell division protein FtsZ